MDNHHLNTLLVYALGEQREWAIYRLPSLLAGTASIALAAALAGRRGPLEAALAAGLCAASFPLVHYSSEARGYALAVFFALAALLALLRYLERGGGMACATSGRGCWSRSRWRRRRCSRRCAPPWSSPATS